MSKNKDRDRNKSKDIVKDKYKAKNSREDRKGERGNLVVGQVIIMSIIAKMFVSVVILTSIEFNKINSNYIGSDSFNTAINIYKSSINTISYNEIKNMSNEIIIIISEKPSRNSVDEIKERINKKLLLKVINIVLLVILIFLEKYLVLKVVKSIYY